MKLSISNIAWSAKHDNEMYAYIQSRGFTGLEIAPTRIFPQAPYEHLSDARAFSQRLKQQYGLAICSMQSIWYGIPNSICGTDADRARLVDYTKKAVDFAEAVHCANLVFGCPKNRTIPSDGYLPVVYRFFEEIGNYAAAHNTCIAIEANPPYYNTNFINTTRQSFDICRRIACSGLKVNVDIGTFVNDEETIELLVENTDLINHIHISEPLLRPIEKREIHKEFTKLADYDGYFSIEMGNKDDLQLVRDTISYVTEVFV